MSFTKRMAKVFFSCTKVFHTWYFDNKIAILAVKKYFLRLLSHSPTVSHTLPAGGVHPRPPLETSISHKSLKRYSSTGPDALHLPPPDYADVDNKAENEQTSSSDTPEISGQY